jgi:hypothetical protein
MKTQTFYPRRAKLIALHSVSVAFVVAGIWALQKGERMMWFPVVFFGCCAVVFLLMLMPGAAYLRIEEQGLTFVSLFRPTTIAWDSVRGFYSGRMMRRSVVYIDYVSGSAGAPRLRALSKALCGHEGALPDTYSHSPEELASILNEAKQSRVGVEPNKLPLPTPADGTPTADAHVAPPSSAGDR